MNLMKFSKVLMSIAVATLAWHATTSTSNAQSTEGCLCIVPDVQNGQPIGSVLEATGQVQVSQRVGFNLAAAGAGLQRGDRIIVGPQSSALISVDPNCRLSIPANTDVVIDPVERNLCIRSSEASGSSTTTAQKIGRFVIGGMMIAGWIDIAVSN